jgi:hypothetical protein
MTHVRVGQVDERLDLRIDGLDHLRGQQIVDDNGTVLEERRRNVLGRRVNLNLSESTVANW